ncbi:MAG: S9 family peptidase [Chloroflexi bacterium]|nr:S9 family peptidase [Chloroflexota bacterium]MDA1270135.1 S9 family peptidase [Chloroflexota bacterium]
MTKSITPDLVYRLRTVGDPALSPDGTLLAYTLGWVDSDSLGSRSRITLVDLGDGSSRELTQGEKDAAAKFSPDGRQVAFLRSVGGAPSQVWAVGTDGESEQQLTHLKKGVFDYQWSPDGQKIVVCADVDPAPDGPAEGSEGVLEGIPQVTVVQRIRYRYDTLGWRGDSHFHLFVLDLESGEVRQITDGDWDDTAPVWSPDGSQIAFMSGRRDDRDFLALSEVYSVPATGGEARLRSEGLFSVGALTWSPDGQRLAVVGSDAPEGMVLWQGWLYVLEEGRVPRKLTDDTVRPYLGFPPVTRPATLNWTGDGRIVYLGERKGESFLFRTPCEGGSREVIWGGSCLATGLSMDQQAGTAVVVATSPASPGDIHRVDLATGQARQVSDHNRAYMQEHPAARLEKFFIQRAGYEIECRLLLPPGFDAANTYPLVLDIHGGPNGAFYDAFVPAQQVLATAGYLVLAVNPRGSSTYGEDFMMAVLGDWGGEDYQDLMAAVDEVCRRPYVDSARLGVHGYSYGGYMTSWTVGHTNRFKAAVVGAPCINLHSMYGTSDIGISFGEAQWGGSVADAVDKMLERSPISYASRVETPVLLLHGDADARCPIGQSEEYFTALKRLGKEVEFVRFPGCSHLFPRMGHAKMREEYLTRTLGWFNRFIT